MLPAIGTLVNTDGMPSHNVTTQLKRRRTRLMRVARQATAKHCRLRIVKTRCRTGMDGSTIDKRATQREGDDLVTSTLDDLGRSHRRYARRRCGRVAPRVARRESCYRVPAWPWPWLLSRRRLPIGSTIAAGEVERCIAVSTEGSPRWDVRFFKKPCRHPGSSAERYSGGCL